jgi:polysaccharide pyruvyl transferase WcaK-like protein
MSLLLSEATPDVPFDREPLAVNAAMARRRLTIGLLWHSVSSNNLGVGALTESQIAICESAARRVGVDVDYFIFGTVGDCNYSPDGIRITQGADVPIKRMFLGNTAYQKQLAQCDVVLDIGEGDSFADIYGIRRFLFLLLSKVAVLARHKTLILSPQTIGPFNNWFARQAAAAVMRRCDKVIARDSLSAAYLRSLDVTGNTEQAIDVAFRLPYTKPARPAGAKVRVGVNVSGLLFSGGYEGGNQFGLTLDYPTLMRKLLAEWTANPDLEVWLIPHVIAGAQITNDDDRAASDLLSREFPTAKRAPDFSSPGAVKSFISGMDFFTGGRMHACIAAFSSGVPVVPLAYSRKFNGLFESLKYPWIADGKTLTTDQALAVIFDGFGRRAELAKTQIVGNQLAITKLSHYENLIVKTFEVAVSRRKEQVHAA